MAYPASIDNFTHKVDGVDSVMAVDVNELQDAIENIETELGTNVAGVQTNLKTRLDQTLPEAANSSSVTASGTITLINASGAIQFINCNGAERIVILPAISNLNHRFTIHNITDENYDIIVNDADGNLVATVQHGNAVILDSNGTAWGIASSSGGEINDLTDVDTSGVADGDLLQYDSGDGLWKPVVPSGVYTPTLYNTTNVAASTAYECQWGRMGNFVIVSGKVAIDPTNDDINTVLGISLPIASNLANSQQVAGTSVQDEVNGYQAAGRITGDTTNDRALLTYKPNLTSNQVHIFVFTYQVIG